MHYFKRQYHKDFQSANATAEKHTVRVTIFTTSRPKLHSYITEAAFLTT